MNAMIDECDIDVDTANGRSIGRRDVVGEFIVEVRHEDSGDRRTHSMLLVQLLRAGKQGQ